MVIGVLTLEFRLHGNDSLKGKRRVAQSLKIKLRNKFNLAVAEVAHQDSCEFLALAAVAVSCDAVRLQSQLQKALNLVVAIDAAELVHDEIEIMHL
ncbi:MAG: DUF503 domain-containing protein [Desulfovibrionaceae bacterium]|nr:DUF503 domain-containing protein [Desulfovibrionaceae bacterium]MBF0515314.1 DUF503 domain-containing protein [Desulfovibrionaceae bacterium]